MSLSLCSTDGVLLPNFCMFPEKLIFQPLKTDKEKIIKHYELE